MGILFENNCYKEVPNSKDKILELGAFLSYKVLKILSLKNIKINGIENIPKDTNFLMVCNHPSYIDGLVLYEIFKGLGLDIDFIVHKGIIENKIVGNTLAKKGFLPVSPHRSKKYFLDKGEKQKQAIAKSKKRVEKGRKYNRSSISEAGSQISKGYNIGIFISGKGYEDDMKKIYGGYKIILKEALKDKKSVPVLPITISFDGNKKGSIPLRSSMNIDILKLNIVNNLDQAKAIEESMRESIDKD